MGVLNKTSMQGVGSNFDWTKQQTKMRPAFRQSALYPAEAGKLLRTRSHVAAQGQELGLDVGGKCWHCSNQGEAHGSGDQAVFDGGCAGFVVDELLHGSSPLGLNTGKNFALRCRLPLEHKSNLRGKSESLVITIDRIFTF